MKYHIQPTQASTNLFIFLNCWIACGEGAVADLSVKLLVRGDAW